MFFRKSLVDLTHKLGSGGEDDVVNAEIGESKRGVTYVSNGSGLGPRASPSNMSSSNHWHQRRRKIYGAFCNLASIVVVPNQGVFLQ